jgi:hypothetical protein
MIIALKGPAQCGKSTLASWIEADLQRRGIATRRTAYSDFVREEIAATLLGVTQYLRGIASTLPELGPGDSFETLVKAFIAEHQLTGVGDVKGCIELLERRPALPSSRSLQQWWGQDFRRAQDPLYWIKKSFAANADFILQDNAILIEESCRQENEGRYVHALGGIVLDLKPLPSPTHSEAAAMSHSIEQAALQWEGEIPVDMGWVFSQSATNQQAWVQDLVGRCIDWIKANGGTITGHH